MEELTTTDKHRALSDVDIPDPPFVVTQKTSGKVYRVNCVLDVSPHVFKIHVNQFGSEKGSGKQETMSDFYRSKYSVDIVPDQPVLLGELGAPIHPDQPAVTPSLSQPKTKKHNARSQLYLVPQMVTLHPMTKHLLALNRIPALLFQIESGLIAKKVNNDLFKAGDNEFRKYANFFSSDNPSYFMLKPGLDLTATALTRPSAMLTVDYEHLEWLGDSVYRFVLAVMGISDAKIRSDYSALMSNSNVGLTTLKHYPDLSNSYVLSSPPSLKNPEVCRVRLQNLNLLADVAEALVAVSLISGGVESAKHTVVKLGLNKVDPDSPAIVSEAPSDLESFVKWALKPAVIRLESSLQLISKGDSATMTIGQLDEARQLLLASLAKTDVTLFPVYKQYCAPLLSRYPHIRLV
jgi:dsRNA-specific ribonuclease